MKSVLSIGILAALLVACSSYTPPYNQRLSQNIRALPPTTEVLVISEESYPAPIKEIPIVFTTGNDSTTVTPNVSKPVLFPMKISFGDIPTETRTVAMPVRVRTVYDVYHAYKHQVIIPAGTIIHGTYVNDDKNCIINWSSVYANNETNDNPANEVYINKYTMPTVCNPETGVKINDLLLINFSGNRD